MNKFKMWHLAVICIAVFLIFGVIAASAIASNRDLQDANNWSIDWDNFGFWNLVPGTEYDIDDSKSIEIDGGKIIDIKCIEADVNITETSGDSIKVHLYGEYKSSNGEIKLVADKSGSTYKIEVDYPRNGVSRTNLTLDIEIPKNYSESIDIYGVSSDINMDTPMISYNEVKVKTVSGDIELHDINANDVDAGSVSGSFNADYISGNLEFNGTSSSITVSEITGSVKAKTVSGSIKFKMDKPYEIWAKTVSGDVRVELETLASFSVDFTSVSGDFECEAPLVLETNKRGNVKGYYDDNNSVTFEVNTTSGDFKILN